MTLLGMVKFKTPPIFFDKENSCRCWIFYLANSCHKNGFRESNSRLASTELILILRISKAYHLVHQIYVAVFHLIGGPHSIYRGHSVTVLV